MRIKRTVERWFECENDPDEARVLIRNLSPGEIQDIYDETMPQEIKYEQDEKGNMVPNFKTDMDRKAQREKTMVACIKDWENFYGYEDELLECNDGNIIRASREIEGFNQFVDNCRNIIAKDIEQEKESQVKNLSSTVSG